MRYVLLTVFIPILLAGCSAYGYRYHPHPQVLYSPIFADYREREDGIDICVDTDGLLLKEIEIVKTDGTAVAPASVDLPPFKSSIVRGIQEEIYGPALADGPTVAHFRKESIGPKPWNVRLNIQAVPTETIWVGGPPLPPG